VEEKKESQEEKLQDEQETEDNANDNVQPDGEQGEDVRTFTQAELDTILTARLSREREKYADYPDLKEKAKRWEEHEIEQMDELEKAKKRADDAEAAIQQANRQAEETLVLATVVAEASKAGAAYPEDAFNLIDRSGVKVEDGKVSGVEEAIKELVDAGRLVMRRRAAPALDANKGSGDREKEKKSEATDEEKEIAWKLGIDPDDYVKGKR